MIGGGLIGRKPFERRAVHDENIRPAVVIIVKVGHACSGCFDNVFLGVHSAEYVCRVQAGFFRDIHEIREVGIVAGLCRRILREQGTAGQKSGEDYPKQRVLKKRSRGHRFNALQAAPHESGVAG